MVREAAEKWSAATALDKTIAAAKVLGSIGVIAFTAIATLGGYASLPGSVKSQQLRIEALESADRAQSARDVEQSRQIAELYRQTGYLVCDGLARSGAGTMTQAECAAAYITGGLP